MEPVHKKQLISDDKNFGTHHFFYFLLAFVGSLSTAAAAITLIALSTSFYEIDHAGVISSSIYVLYYLGIGFIGIGGGWILQRFPPISLGIVGPLGSAGAVFFLAYFGEIDPSIGLPVIFLIFLLNGIDHPNNMRFFNAVISEKDKMFFFSMKESSAYILGLAAPILAIFVINSFGVRACFLISTFLYSLSCIPWLLLKYKMKPSDSTSGNLKLDFLIGFKLLITNRKIRQLNISRLLNNLSYVTWTASLPILIAKIARGDVEMFTAEQGIAMSVVSSGFILASFLGTWIGRKQPRVLTVLIWAASLLGYGAIGLLALSLIEVKFLYLSAFFQGLGTYCFRISGMTIGQAVTPKENLGPVIIAGDAIVRLWSFLISILVVGMLQIYDVWETYLPHIGILLLILPTFSLLSPFLTIGFAKSFLEQNSTREAELKS
jgi:MFS family permease